MTILFDANATLQNDQTAGTQTTDGDTDIAYNDLRLAALKASVTASGYSADTAFAALVSGAYSADVMTVTGTGTVEGLKFTDPDGGTLDGDPSGLTTADGYEILLYASDDGRTVYGVYSDGSQTHLAFAVQMNVTLSGTTATVDLVTISYAPVASPTAGNPDETVSLGDYLFISAQDSTGFDFSALASTKFLYGVVGSANGGFLVIGKDPAIKADGTPTTGGAAGDLVNSSQGGGGVTIGLDNQQFTGDTDTTTAEDGAYFTYIKGLTAGTYDDADDIAPTAYISVDTAKLQISQVQGNGTQGMRLTALDYDGATDGRDFVADLTTADQGSIVEFLSIHITNTDGTDVTVTQAELEAGIVTKDGFTFSLNADGSVDILGLGAKDWVEWTTDGLHDRILVEALSGKWDIGAFEIEEISTATTSIGGQIKFGDDAPTVDLTLDAAAALVLDESTGTDPADANADDGLPLAQRTITADDYLSAVTASFGTDGAGEAAGNDVWALSTAGGDSGLVASGSGLSVYLFLESGAIVGREGTSALDAATGDEVLRFAIYAETGTITVTQSLALAHDDTTDGDDAAQMAGTGLVTVTRTLTDADDDPAHDSADLTAVFVFEDDAPTVTATGNAAPDLFTADSDFTTDDSASFAGLFTSDFGNDGMADADALTYALGIKSDGADSGLTDTETGDAILLKLVDGVVTGTLAGDPTKVAFTISVDATGTVTLDQSRAVVHDDPADAVESGASAAVLASADLVTLTATATDGDGDSASKTLDIADSFSFGDDGVDVSLTGETGTPLMTDDSTLGSDGPVDLSGLFDITYGNDGAGDAPTYALGLSAPDADSGLTDTATGDRILLRLAGTGTVEGYLDGDAGTVAFTITLDTATGEVSLTQSRAIAHDDPADSLETGTAAETMAASLITLTATATDGDTDHDAATAQIGDLFQFEDDGPEITRSATAVPVLITDDSDLAPTDSATASFAALFSIDAGNDGASATLPDLYELGIKAGTPETALYDTATGSAILLRVVGGVVEGYLEGDETAVAFTIAVDADGDVTLTQARAIRHDDPDDPAETQAAGDAETMAADLVTLSRTTHDGDNDSATLTIDIGDAFAFEDDGPSVTLIPGTMPDLTTSDATLGAAGPIDFAGFFDASFGKDGAAASDALAFSLTIASAGADSGLTDTATGDAILLKLVDGVVTGYLQNHPTETAFTISVDADGKVTLDQLRAIAHDDPDDPAETGPSAATMALAGLITLVATATDGDGDHASQSLDITAAFAFTDDGPTFQPLDSLAVDFPGTGGTSTDSALLGYDTGNDGYGDLRITDYDASLMVNGKTLTGVLNTAGTLLTYYHDANLNGVIDSGETAFTYALKDLLGTDGLAGSDGQLDTSVITLFNMPSAPTLDYDFRDLPAGQNGFGILSGRTAGAALPDPDAPSILILGNKAAYNPDHTFSNTSSTINTSKGGGPTTIGVSNQMIDPKEAVWFSYLTDPANSFVSGVSGGLSQSEADDFDNIQFTGGLTEVKEAFFKVVQVQGSPKFASLEINAYDIDDSKPLQGTGIVDELNRLGLASVTAGAEPEQVIITSVTINATEYDRVEAEGAGLITWQADGGVTLLRVAAGDTIIFETDTEHDAALITGLSGKFDIGDYGIDQSFDTADTALDITLTLTDGDEDWTTAIQSILIDGSGS